MFTKTQMNTKIGAVTRSATTLRDNVQAIVLSAAGYAFGNGDTQYFTKLRAGIVGVNVTKLDKFIEASFPVKFDKGSETYKIDKTAMKELRADRLVSNDPKDITDADAVDYVSDVTAALPAWYSHSDDAAGKGGKPVNPAKVISDAADRVTKAQEKGKLAEDGWTLAELEVAQSKVLAAIAALQGKSELPAVTDHDEQSLVDHAAAAADAPVHPALFDTVIDTRLADAPTMHMVAAE
jgi:hypothetical protein